MILKPRSKRLLVIFLISLWFGVFVLIIFRAFILSQKQLRLVFCDVGQGDAILVTQKNTQVLIDGGPPSAAEKLLRCLSQAMPFWDRQIEVVVNTHPEEDHLGGLIAVFQRYRVNWFFYNGLANSDSEKFNQLKNYLFEHQVCSKILAAGDRFRIGKIYFDSLWPGRGENWPPKAPPTEFFDPQKRCPKPQFQKISDSLNNYSIVLHLKFGQFDALLTGDIPAEVEQVLTWRQQLPQVEVLKIAHHGSKTSTSEELLQATQPKLAIISVGQNKFGHPSSETLSRLEKFGTNYFRTDQKGTIELVVGGDGFKIR